MKSKRWDGRRRTAVSFSGLSSGVLFGSTTRKGPYFVFCLRKAFFRGRGQYSILEMYAWIPKLFALKKEVKTCKTTKPLRSL